MKLRAHLWLRFLLVAFVVLLSANDSSAANFSLSLNSTVGDPVGKGVSSSFDQTNAILPYQYANPSLYFHFFVKSTDTSGVDWYVEFSGAAGGPLAVGTYNVDTDDIYGRDLNQPFLCVRRSDTSVSRIRGQFEVKKMTYSANKGVSLWVTFTQYVNGSSAALSGELKYEADADLTPYNLPPRVYAGPDRVVDLGAAIPFKAVVQDDGLPNGTVSVKWAATGSSNPGPMVISAPDATETTVTFLSEGTYKLAVTASDGELSYSWAVTVNVQPPENFNLLRIQLPVPLMKQPSGVIELHGPRDKFYQDPFSSYAQIRVEDSTVSWTERWEVDFSLPNDFKPSRGTYPVGKDIPGAMTVVIRQGFGDSPLPVVGGSVQVLSVEYRSGGSLLSFHALFTLYTDETVPPVMGEIRFRVNPDLADTKPLVSAGIDRAFTSVESPLLQGGVFVRGSTASPPEVRWSKVSGPGEVVFTDGTAPITPVAFSEPGTYVLRMDVTDETGVHSDEVQITALGYEISIATKSLGRSDYYFPPNHRITASLSGDSLEFTATEKATYSTKTFTFKLPPNQQFVPGIYRAYADQSGQTAIYVPYGFDADGQFEIRELELNDKGQVVRAWVKYKLDRPTWHEPEYEQVEGEIRFHTAAAGTSVNRAPLVNVGPDLVTDKYSLQLSASIADDLLPYGSKLRYAWKQLSGPSNVELDAPSSHKTKADFFEPGIYRLLFSVTDGEFTSTDELVVAIGSTKRSYEGVIQFNDSIVGRAVINLTPGNAFSARIRIGSSTSTLKGSLSKGSWSRSGTDSQGRSVSISFSRTDSGEVVTGFITIDGQSLEISARQTFGSFQRAIRKKCPYQGRYTHILLPPQGAPVRGAGYGEIVVQPSGAYWLKGTLADGVPFSAGGHLTIEGNSELYIRLRNGHENVVGPVSFSEPAVEGLVGRLGWSRGTSAQQPLFPDGLRVGLLMRGSRYQAPSKGTMLFPPATSATMSLRLFDSSLPTSIAPQLTFSGEQIQVTGAPDGFNVKFDANTGYFRGTFKDPANSATRRFGGVLLQGLKIGAGYFLVEDHCGGVSLQAAE